MSAVAAEPSASHLPAEGTVTMFSTTWCGYCRVLKKALDLEFFPELLDVRTVLGS